MNGKALGGYMSRSQFSNLALPPQEQEQSSEPLVNLTTELTTSEFYSDATESREENGLGPGIGEDLKKSFKVMDHDLLDAGSVMQETGSDTESTRTQPQRRSKRAKRRMVVADESLTELEIVVNSSSASDEDGALCLVMLSRDSWRCDETVVELKLSQTRVKHRCDICKKVFKSSQALGSHKIVHGKVIKKKPTSAGNVDKRVMHECPFCGKLFRSGQALGGHKRSHFSGSGSSGGPTAKLVVNNSFGKSIKDGPPIDLNQPAPMDDEDLTSQQEASAVSDDCCS